MTHGKPCVKLHVFTRHMASHVSTCMKCAIQYKWEEISSVEGQPRRKEIEKRKRKRKGRERKEREERKREGRRKGERKREKRKSAFRQLELVGPRSKVWRFDEGLLFKR